MSGKSLINAPRMAGNSFRCSQHMFLSLEDQIALFEKVSAHTLELNVQPFGFHVKHRSLNDPFSHGLSWTSLEFLVKELLHLSFFFVASPMPMALSCDFSRYFTPATMLSRVSLSAPVERRTVPSSVVSAYFRAEPVKRDGNRAP